MVTQDVSTARRASRAALREPSFPSRRASVCLETVSAAEVGTPLMERTTERPKDLNGPIIRHSSDKTSLVGTPTNQIIRAQQRSIGTPTVVVAVDPASAAVSSPPRKRLSSSVSIRAGSVGSIRALIGANRHDGRRLLWNVVRAFLVRVLFVVHSLTTIWAAVNARNDASLWTFALVSALIAIDGAYTIVMRAGDERKWFSPSVLLYICATAPSLHLLETQICEWRKSKSLNRLEETIHFQLLEQLLLVILIIGRWLLPKGEISREQLSQILLAYLAISSDIVEFFDVFKEDIVYENQFLQRIVLGAWTLSLLQFPFVLTVSRARKMRVAITDKVVTKTYQKFSQIIYDIDLWAIIIANGFQDIPFFVVRLYLVAYHGLVTYTMLFFICKNALIIILQTYRYYLRAFIIINDRYGHEKSHVKKEDHHRSSQHLHSHRHHHHYHSQSSQSTPRIPIESGDLEHNNNGNNLRECKDRDTVVVNSPVQAEKDARSQRRIRDRDPETILSSVDEDVAVRAHSARHSQRKTPRAIGQTPLTTSHKKQQHRVIKLKDNFGFNRSIEST